MSDKLNNHSLLDDIMTKVALSIAGSDPGGGAGIQADIKTFLALGVYGCTAITTVTAQNTQKVSGIYEISPEVIRRQIQSILIDIPPLAIKIGMVHSKPIIETVSRSIKGSVVPVILDPIFAAGTGGKLLLDNALESFISELIPISMLMTPNVKEAEKLSGVEVKSENNAIKAAEIIKKLGTKSVIIKGGHGDGKYVTDILLDSKDNLVKISNPRINIEDTHGSGCNFSAAATAFFARGFQQVDACKLANQFVYEAIKKASNLGKGLIVTDPGSIMYEYANRYNVLQELQYAVDKIQKLDNIGRLIPETQSNIAFALPDAKNILDVAGVKGRIIKIESLARSASFIEFGASKHVATAVLSYMFTDRSIRAAMNIKFDEKILHICQSLFQISDYERHMEPEGTKKREGTSVFWGIKNALLKNPKAEVIYHKGDIGKEPMTLVFGRDPKEVIYKIKKILKKY
ncbi:MAG TPA: bifunctional hydroxymethylpyrimidine kinase/phosphomethylpyrimidine kinase [Nitrososphaeraceae archaeon]|nr:bifunctional hydroxymethylpyrimidine kinase/phosphomethylpyrimidine kinase [Nitrososphaeraceae archaeon]